MFFPLTDPVKFMIATVPIKAHPMVLSVMDLFLSQVKRFSNNFFLECTTSSPTHTRPFNKYTVHCVHVVYTVKLLPLVHHFLCTCTVHCKTSTFSAPLPAQHTLGPLINILNSTQYTVLSTLYIVHSTVYNVHSTHSTVQNGL